MQQCLLWKEKPFLFKEFGGVNAVPICLDTQDTEEIIRTIVNIAPAFGGINLEDISAPRCFEIEERLKELLDIPVFHDDQHGTAVVVLAGIINALKVTGKKKEACRIVVMVQVLPESPSQSFFLLTVSAMLPCVISMESFPKILRI